MRNSESRCLFGERGELGVEGSVSSASERKQMGTGSDSKAEMGHKGLQKGRRDLQVMQVKGSQWTMKGDDGNTGEPNHLQHRSQLTPSRQDFPSRGHGE